MTKWVDYTGSKVSYTLTKALEKDTEYIATINKTDNIPASVFLDDILIGETADNTLTFISSSSGYSTISFASHTEMDIEWVQLKKGNMATDWTRAPEDTDAKIDHIQTEWTHTFDTFGQTVSDIDGRVTSQKQTINKISSTVSGHSGRLSVVEQTALGIQSAVYNADGSSKITQLADGYNILVESTANTQSQISVLQDNINLRVTKGELLSQINVQAGGVLITSGTNKLNITPETTFIKDATIKSAMIDTVNVKQLTGITADFTSMVTKALTANTITSTMIKADDAMFSKLFATSMATDKLVAQGAWITNANIVSLDAGTIKSGTIATARLDAEAIVTAGLTANVVKSEHILGSTALIDKIFAQDAYITRLTGKTAFINSIKAINISASIITSGTLDASKITVTNLDASSITGNKTSFVQSAWNAINSRLSVTGSELKYTHSDGSYTRLNANGIQTVVGGSAYQHNYLTHVSNITINSGSAGNVKWVQLPSVFKGKQFEYFMGATDIYGAVTEDAYYQNKMMLKRFVLIKHPDYNIDYANARIPILGYAHYVDIDTRKDYFRALQGIVFAQY